MSNLDKKNKTRIDHLIGLLLAVVYVVALLLTSFNLGYSRDEGFYFKASRNYQKWFDVLSDDPSVAIKPGTIKKHWNYNHEHPVLMKTLFGFSDRILNKKLEWLSPSTALRFPTMLFAGLSVYVLFIWGAFAFSRGAGFFAAMSFALMPRVFYHAHLCCFDVPITTAMLIVTYLYWKSLRSKRAGIFAGIAIGFAFCVKLNAFFLPAILGMHFIFVYIMWRKNGKKGQPPKGWAFLYGLIFSPIIFMAHWPWLWHDTLQRISFYLGFHSGHAFYNTAYFGQNIIEAPTPILLPLVMTLFTVPTIIVLLGIIGIGIRTFYYLPKKSQNKISKTDGIDNLYDNQGLDVLWLVSLAFPIVLISLPSVPIFGGTKHWMPAMPYLALFGGIAVCRIVTLLLQTFKTLKPQVLCILVLLFVLMAPLQQTIASHPFGIASYVPFIGGARGAASLGMLRQFWGYTTAGVLPFLNREVSKNGKVWFHDTSGSSLKMFKEEGSLRKDIRISNIRNSDFALTHHELHMVLDEAIIWNDYKTFIPKHILTYQGIPMVTVYENDKKSFIKK